MRVGSLILREPNQGKACVPWVRIGTHESTPYENTAVDLWPALASASSTPSPD
jgi:hypothetical protein